MEEQKTPEKIIVTHALLSKVFNYLTSRPYAEVSSIIHELQSTSVIYEETKKEEVKDGTDE